MVRQYAEQADEVIILISSPLRASRVILGQPISTRKSLMMLE
jgi:hypothetical protein